MPSAPEPFGRDAPKFLHDKPIELNRFIERVEGIFEKCAITEDDEKIKLIRSYADTTSDNEWGAFDATSYASFRKDLLRSYPDAEILRTGSLSALNRICDAYKGIMVDDRREILDFRRKFTAEAKKLSSGTDGVIGNREIAARIWGIMSSNLANEIRTRLLIEAAKPRVVPLPARRIDDPYLWSDILERLDEASAERAGETTLQVARGSAFAEASTARAAAETQAPSDTIKREDFESFTAKLQDTFVISTKKMMADMDERIKQVYSHQQSRGPTQSTFAPAAVQRQWDSPQRMQGCFYCTVEGHRIGECPKRMEHLKKNFIKEVNGRICLPNGNMIPRDLPGRTMADRIENWNKAKMEVHLFAGYSMEDFGYGGDANANDQGDFASYFNLGEANPVTHVEHDANWSELQELKKQMAQITLKAEQEKLAQLKLEQENNLKRMVESYMTELSGSQSSDVAKAASMLNIPAAQLEQLLGTKTRGTNSLEPSSGFD